MLEAGSEPASFEVDGLRVGLSVCYDLRFPSCSAVMRRLICCWCPPPSPTPPARRTGSCCCAPARVENQCYVLAPPRAAPTQWPPHLWAHGLIDPWGQVLAVQAEGEGVVIGEVDPARVARCASSCRR